jgi:hypothetical protein
MWFPELKIKRQISPRTLAKFYLILGSSILLTGANFLKAYAQDDLWFEDLRVADEGQDGGYEKCRNHKGSNGYFIECTN